MARTESDREDLLREATALVQRVELQVQGWAEPLVVGFRANGAASFFFGSDPVYQFDTSGQLRRAFIDGLLLKAEHGKLIALERRRLAHEVNLVRTELTVDATNHQLDQLRLHFDRLQSAIDCGAFEIIGQIPSTEDIVGRIGVWLRQLHRPIVIASSPRIL